MIEFILFAALACVAVVAFIACVGIGIGLATAGAEWIQDAIEDWRDR